MAQFEIIDDEGIRFVKITLLDESICAERGALCYMVGDIKVTASLPSLPGVVKSALSEQAFIRPRYSGTGTIYLESSFAGFSELELTGEPWILSSGVFWASEEGVDLSVHLENMMTQLLVQDDLINFQTKVKGKGTVIIRSQGPVVKVQVDGQRVVTDGRYVIARTEGVKYISRRSAQTILGSLISGESFRLRAFEGKGTVLISSYPFWKYRLMQMRQTGEMDPKEPME
jgi:uncharacterized protein (AIM24 family)